MHNENKWRIITLYSRNVEENLEAIMEEIQEEEEGHPLLGGNFNTRTRRKGGSIRAEEKEEEETRRSKDKEINKEGIILLNKCRERD